MRMGVLLKGVLSYVELLIIYVLVEAFVCGTSNLVLEPMRRVSVPVARVPSHVVDLADSSLFLGASSCKDQLAQKSTQAAPKCWKNR